MQLARQLLAEEKVQHVEEMHADIHREATGLAGVRLPGLAVPLTAGGNVGQLDLMPAAGASACTRSSRCQRPSQLKDGWMEAQLQYRIDPASARCLEVGQLFQSGAIEYQRLFTDHVTAKPQAGSDMGLMQVVGRADAEIVEAAALAPEPMPMVLEALELGKEESIGREAVQ